MLKAFFVIGGLLFFVPTMIAQHDFVMRAANVAAARQPPNPAVAVIFPAAVILANKE
ncbi:MAG: hypothetical protein WCJ64_04885 [Rhodospirillaceae bacterium]